MIHSRYQQIDSDLFQNNRKKLSAKLKKNQMAIVFSSDEMPRNADCNFPFRQDSNFFYLTGIEQERSILIQFPKCPNPAYRSVLFLRPTDEHTLIWEGKRYSKEEAQNVSGIETVLWLGQFEKILDMLFEWTNEIYVNVDLEENLDINFPVLRAHRYGSFLKNNYSEKKFLNVLPIMTELRVQKSEKEIELIKKACNITNKAFRSVLEKMSPGKMEYEIEAEISYIFSINGATGHAYSPIIAGGKNACVLHYIKNNEQIQANELVLMDFGAEYGHYASDLTRTIPSDGKFTERQSAVYQAVLDTMKYAIDLLKPGVILSKYHLQVGEFVNTKLLELGLLTKEEIEKSSTAFKKYFMHGTSHFMGLDVHDLGKRDEPLQPGNVVTCEPGIYIPEENIGVRIENDILITEEGNIDLMADIPVEIKEIEQLMQ